MREARGGLKLPRTLRLRGEANQCASDTLEDSRVQKPKNFLAFFSRLLPPPLRRESEKEMERKFLVLLRRSHNYIVFYHTIVSRRNISYTQNIKYDGFIQKIGCKYEKD